VAKAARSPSPRKAATCRFETQHNNAVIKALKATASDSRDITGGGVSPVTLGRNRQSQHVKLYGGRRWHL